MVLSAALLQLSARAGHAWHLSHTTLPLFLQAAPLGHWSPALAPMAATEQKDSLRNAFFSSTPRYLVYIDLETRAADTPSRHYLVYGRPSVKQPSLWLLYPTADAPPNTPHLCAVLSESVDAMLKSIEGLRHYTHIPPGENDPQWLEIAPEFAKRLAYRTLRLFCTSWSDAQVANLLVETLQLPKDFQVSLLVTNTHMHAHTHTHTHTHS